MRPNFSTVMAIFWIVTALTSGFSSSQHFPEFRQDEEIGPVQQTGETLAGVASLLTSIFNGLTTAPVNAVHAAIKAEADRKTAEAQAAHLKNASKQTNATKSRPKPPTNDVFVDLKSQLLPQEQLSHQFLQPQVIHPVAPQQQIIVQPVPQQIPAAVQPVANVPVTTPGEDVDEDGDEDEDTKKLLRVNGTPK